MVLRIRISEPDRCSMVQGEVNGTFLPLFPGMPCHLVLHPAFFSRVIQVPVSTAGRFACRNGKQGHATLNRDLEFDIMNLAFRGPCNKQMGRIRSACLGEGLQIFLECTGRRVSSIASRES